VSLPFTPLSQHNLLLLSLGPQSWLIQGQGKSVLLSLVLVGAAWSVLGVEQQERERAGKGVDGPAAGCQVPTFLLAASRRERPCRQYLRLGKEGRGQKRHRQNT